MKWPTLVYQVVVKRLLRGMSQGQVVLIYFVHPSSDSYLWWVAHLNLVFQKSIFGRLKIRLRKNLINSGLKPLNQSWNMGFVFFIFRNRFFYDFFYYDFFSWKSFSCDFFESSNYSLVKVNFQISRKSCNQKFTYFPKIMFFVKLTALVMSSELRER